MLITHEREVPFSEVGKEYPGYEDVFAKVLVGKDQGWKDYTMKVFEILPKGHTDCHSHEYLHIMFVLSGQGTVVVDDVPTQLEAGSALFFTPDCVHQIQNNGTEVFRYIFVTTNYDTFISKHT